ncbi:hypothetical protein [Streptomyces sp. NPDC020489]|uniref:hypothetical protein n=1 Tax=Streptomyces sp. NPDC020489 TaxID=3365077 RepID=UPI0037ADB815
MDTLIALDGYLDDHSLPDDDVSATTASFQLVVCPTDDRVDELVIPCLATDPDLVRAVLTDLDPQDLLRVTGYLQLPDHPGDGLRLHVYGIDVLDSGTELATVDSEQDLQPDSLAPQGLLERHAAYQLWHDPDTGRSSVWHVCGTWVGATDDPSRLEDVIAAHEQPPPPTDQP